MDESKLRSSAASASALLASMRRVEAFASPTRDSVDHLAAAKPDHAANSATTESSAASVIEMSRPRRSSASSLLRVLADLLPDLARRKAFRHRGSLTPPRLPRHLFLPPRR